MNYNFAKLFYKKIEKNKMYLYRYNNQLNIQIPILFLLQLITVVFVAISRIINLLFNCRFFYLHEKISLTQLFYTEVCSDYTLLFFTKQ